MLKFVVFLGYGTTIIGSFDWWLIWKKFWNKSTFGLYGCVAISYMCFSEFNDVYMMTYKEVRLFRIFFYVPFHSQSNAVHSMKWDCALVFMLCMVEFMKEKWCTFDWESMPFYEVRLCICKCMTTLLEGFLSHS